jgi:hypothetical protein
MLSFFHKKVSVEKFCWLTRLQNNFGGDRQEGLERGQRENLGYVVGTDVNDLPTNVKNAIC